MTGVRSRDVACGIARGDRSRDIAVSSQHRTGNIHAPGLAIGIHCRLVRFRTHFNGNRITDFHFITDLTGDGNCLTGLGRIDDVIGRDIVDSDRRHWRDGIHTVSVAGIRGSHVTCGIARGDRRRDITVSSQYRTGNIDAPGFTVGIHRGLVRFRANFNGNRITRFDVVIDLTGDRNGLTGFARIDHVIAGDIINRD